MTYREGDEASFYAVFPAETRLQRFIQFTFNGFISICSKFIKRLSY